MSCVTALPENMINQGNSVKAQANKQAYDRNNEDDDEDEDGSTFPEVNDSRGLDNIIFKTTDNNEK